MVEVWGRLVIGILALLVLALLITGCSNCREVKVYEKEPITTQVEAQGEKEYSHKEKYFEEVCTEKDKYENNLEITYDDVWWLYDTSVKYNQLKRTVYIDNAGQNSKLVYFNMIYMQDGEQVDKARNPIKAILAKNQKAHFFLVWNTEYDPTKSIEIELVNQTKSTQTYCMNVTKYRNMTDTRATTEMTDNIEYKNVVKTKTVCD